MRVNFNQDGSLNYAGLSSRCSFDKLCDSFHRHTCEDVKTVHFRVVNED